MPQTGRIILIDDDPDFSASLKQLLMLEDLEAEVFRDAEAALATITPEFTGAVLSDYRFRRMDAARLLSRLRSIRHNIPLVIICGPEFLVPAADLMKHGLFEVLEKPVQIDPLLSTVASALAVNAPAAPEPAPEPEPEPEPEPIDETLPLGDAPAIAFIRLRIPDIAERDQDYLLTGEDGVGKEFIARSIAGKSARADGPFMVVDCAGLPADTAKEALLGQSTDLLSPISAGPKSLADKAQGGVLFLKNIEKLPRPAQDALIERIKSRRALEIAGMIHGTSGFRLVGSNSADLGALADSGGFNAALFAHLSATTVSVPPLRKRGEDAVMLFDRFLTTEMAALDLPHIDMSDSLKAYILGHDWAGNLSELRDAARAFAESTKAAVDEAQTKEP